LHASRSEALRRANLTEEHREATAQDLQKQKQNQLTQFMLTLILSVTLITTGIVIQLLLTLIGIGLAVLSVILYMKYQRTDRLLTATAEVQTLNKQIQEANTITQNTQQKLKQYTLETGFKNHEEVDEAISATNQQIMQITRQPSIDRVEPLIQSAQEEIAELERTDPNGKLQSLEQEITDILRETKNLEETKPPLANSLQYDELAHKEAEKKADDLLEEARKLETQCAGIRANITQLETDLRSLKADFERLPTLETEYKNIKYKETVLELVTSELDETSRKLRSQVMPYARLIINQILPILTDGRYSEFEIAEDLKFKAHSNEAGGYKEREIFSGGTQDQFLIALRLAFTQSILDSRVKADRYCLLMDECISSSDDQRKQGIFEVLDATKKTFSQIFVIAHEDISNFTDHHITLSRNRHGYTELQSKSW
jgi:exonuclease SbcC